MNTALLEQILPLAVDNTEWLVLEKTFGWAVVETLLMTFISSILTVILGIPLGLLAVSTSKDGLTPNRFANQILSAIVNIGRSIPFIILIVAILPFTRFIVGTTIGWQAALVPLTISAVPFFARLVETSVRSVDSGKIEAAQMMGATRLGIMFGVQIREALPALVQSITVLVISLLGFSAMAGTIGAGGLGQLAINYGYNRFMPTVMLVSVIGVVIIVQVIQMVGDMISRLVDHR
ncbi:ABC transporter, permease protein [Gleimia coleocanis DSM 15436]|uniref:ABC transporter, permease protein n=1 Tax=Gleimia coleocanis DSM 15436 TaxID=525245 RepID=C0W262_9ACTO|nr:methionine ABC transporter permease [Gleimia coleocanis]EEH63276.1 ABC transporter, permease protein [Gleimia coleocanis DSM 15436]